MAYRDDILALSPDHYWTWDNTHNDIGVGPSSPRNTNQSGGNTATLTGVAITEDSAVSLNVGTTTQRTECADSAQINSAEQSRRVWQCWFRSGEITRPPGAIYKEGGGTNNFAVLLGFGNNIIAQAVDAGDYDIQCYSDLNLTVGRVYHICWRFSGSGFDNEFVLFIDGVQQQRTSPAPPAPNKTTMASHGADIDWGDPDGNINVGGQGTSLAGAVGQYAHCASWSGANAALSDAQIRTLFELGAAPTHTVTNQAQLDALASSTISDTPLAIRVDVPGSIALRASAILFESASIHVQYTGNGTLTWTNGAGSNASIVSTTNGGTVNIVSEVELRVTGLTNPSEVRIFNSGTTTEVAGQEDVITGEFSAFLNNGTSPAIDIVILSLGFQNIRIDNLDLTLGDLSVPIQQIIDRQYENP